MKQICIITCICGFLSSVNFATLPVTSGLRLWLDASHTDSLVSRDGSLNHGDRIQIWKDLLTGDNVQSDDFSQLQEQNQPVWFQKAGVLNGSSAVLFDGSKTFLSSSSLYIGPETTVFVVAQNALQLDSPGSVHRPILAADNNPFRPDGTGYGLAYQYPLSREFVVSLGNGTMEEKLVGSDFNRQDWGMNIIIFRREGSQSSELWQRTARDNEAVLMGTQTALTKTTGLWIGYELGAETGHSARYYKGFISEVIIYNRRLNDTEMELVVDYLYDKHVRVLPEDPFGALLYLPFDDDWISRGLLTTETGTVVTYNNITPLFGKGIRGKCLDLSHAVMSTSAGCVLFGKAGAEDTALESQLNGMKSITLCGWFNSPNGPLKAFSGFMGRMGQVMVRSYDNDSRLVLGINNQWTPTDNSIVFNETGEWTFWAVSYDGTAGSNNVKWYKGDEAGGFWLLKTQTLNTGTLVTVHDELAVGNLLTSGAYCFAGLLDELRIFGSKTDSSGALSQALLQDIYENGRSVYCGDFLHPYPPGDMNKDCTVDFSDLAELMFHWQVDVN